MIKYYKIGDSRFNNDGCLEVLTNDGWITCKCNDSDKISALLVSFILTNNIDHNDFKKLISSNQFIIVYGKAREYIKMIRKNIYDENRLILDEYFKLSDELIDLIRNS